MKLTKIFVLVMLSAGLVFNSCCKRECSTKEETKKEAHSSAFGIMQLDEMHKVIHPLQHKALPNNDIAAIRAGAPKLLEESKKVQSAQLPENLMAKKVAFDEGAQKLVALCEDLNSKATTGTDDEVKMVYVSVHEAFENLVGQISE